MKIYSILIALIMGTACKQGVYAEIDVDPEVLCVPGETEISWDVESVGTPGISITVTDTDSPTYLYPGLPFATTSATGTLAVAVPEGQTEFQINASASGKSSTDTVTVTGLGSDSLAGQFTFEPDCSDDGSVNGWYPVDVSGYDPAISPRGITNTSNRQIIITHGGISDTLEQRETSSAWNGTELNGKWSVSARLLNRTLIDGEMVTESCSPTVGPGGYVSPNPGDPTRTIRLQSLSASFTFGCG
ncbi:MAG: hypothetical protein AAFR51_02990 [Pseudomonadota bacterium]